MQGAALPPLRAAPTQTSRASPRHATTLGWPCRQGQGSGLGRAPSSRSDSIPTPAEQVMAWREGRWYLGVPDAGSTNSSLGAPCFVVPGIHHRDCSDRHPVPVPLDPHGEPTSSRSAWHSTEAASLGDTDPKLVTCSSLLSVMSALLSCSSRVSRWQMDSPLGRGEAENGPALCPAHRCPVDTALCPLPLSCQQALT